MKIFVSHLVDGFSRDTGAGVHVRVSDGVGVGVRYPGHLPLPGPHVGGGHVDAGAQEPLLGQLDGEPSRIKYFWVSNKKYLSRY